MTQTSVSEFRDKYVAGQLHNPSIVDTESRLVDDSTNILPGDVVLQSTLDIDVVGAVAAFTKVTFQGIAIWNAFQNEKALSTGLNTYEDDQPIPILKRGVIAVLLGDTVAKGGTGFFVHTTGGDSTLHTWRIDLDTNKASEVPGVYLQGGDSGDIVLFRLSIDAGIGSVLT